MSRRILCIDLPDLPAERAWRQHLAESRGSPESPGSPKSPESSESSGSPGSSAARPRPPIVLTRSVGNTLRVESVCSHAAQRGLRPGITLAQAQATVPTLLHFAHEPERDAAFLHRLADWAQRFSPLVEPVSPCVLLLDITGCQRLLGPDEQIAAQAVAGLARLGLPACAAAADTIGAAWALATAGRERICVAPPGLSSVALAPLPPAALRIEPRTAQRLSQLGVRTIGDLLMLPRSSLPGRFGPELLLRIQQALGEVFEPLTPRVAERLPSVDAAFEAPLHDADVIRMVAARLLCDLCGQVFSRGLALRRFDCILLHEHEPPRRVAVNLSQPSRRLKHIERLLLRRLERVELSAGVTAVQLAARDAPRWVGRQSDLFSAVCTGHDEALANLLDEFAARLGQQAVLRARLVDDYQPELAVRLVPVAEAGLDPGSPAEPTVATRRALNRPARVLSRPLAVRVLAIVPEGPPVQMQVCGREYRIQHAWGPERLETGWWRGPDVRRDYFRVLLESGELAWVFYDSVRREWFLHGWFI